REDPVDGEIVHLGIYARRGLAGKDHPVIEVPGLPCRGFHTHVGCDASEHDRVDPAPAQLQVQFVPGECPPLPLGDQYVALSDKALREFTETSRKTALGVGWIIHRCAQDIFGIRGPSDIYKYNWCACGAEFLGE